jgi:hypothetical protein
MMCCKLPGIEELQKPADQWCRHAVTGKGCGIYEDRPAVCRSFHCQWLLDPALGGEWKPEKAKFVLYRDREKEELFNVAVDPAFPDAWTRPPFFAMIKQWVLDGAERGRFVMVRVGKRWTAVLPDRIVELDKVEDDFAVMRERGPTGRTIGLRLVPGLRSPTAPHSESDRGA